MARDLPLRFIRIVDPLVETNGTGDGIGGDVEATGDGKGGLAGGKMVVAVN